MYFFFFWPFRVLGFILTLYALHAFAEKFLPNQISGNTGAIISLIAIIGSALFWLNFVDLYFKLMNPEQKVKIKMFTKEVMNNGLTLSDAAQILNIQRSTLSGWMN